MNGLRQEPDRVAGPLLLASLIVVATIFLCLGAVWLLMGGEPARAASRDSPAGVLPDDDERPFQLATSAERRMREDREKLARYGWVDRSRGVIHVPVEVAARLYLEKRAAAPRGATP